MQFLIFSSIHLFFLSLIISLIIFVFNQWIDFYLATWATVGFFIKKVYERVGYDYKILQFNSLPPLLRKSRNVLFLFYIYCFQKTFLQPLSRLSLPYRLLDYLKNFSLSAKLKVERIFNKFNSLNRVIRCYRISKMAIF